jgi:hypothetical protein
MCVTAHTTNHRLMNTESLLQKTIILIQTSRRQRIVLKNYACNASRL